MTTCASYVASVILRIMYGKSRPTTIFAPEIVIIHKMFKRSQNLMRPGALLVERFPKIRYLPEYTIELEKWKGRKVSFSMISSIVLRKNGRPAKLDPHFLSSFPRINLRTSFRTKKWPISPAQEKVQEELDTIIGRDRALMLDDYGSLPQIEAFKFMLECLRWRPVTTIVFAHRALTDIPHRDICIPEGAIVFGQPLVPTNVHSMAISRDPNVYPNPDRFDPERWLDSDGKIREDLKFPS
ncbi:cytochrome P450 [Suillus discolor]|uniref:Cytochrome P450 n=1 Tax=Suillus discolor TaxID=1912936 RepID=A0A9P7F0P8_9AGAM|nr:cytochrome P450 [Suillus discolor]KAG2099615.1 cytochrome P450 [Suillus discolor]